MNIQSGDKLYLITREDISAGYQCVQSAHALMQFSMENSELTKQGFERSNYLCSLSVRNEKELQELICKAKEEDIIISIFREPDINNEITAIALSPGEKSKLLTRNLKLALKGK